MLIESIRPQAECRMAGFLFRLQMEDGSPAEPSRLESAVPNWRAGDVISLGRRQLRVIDKRDDDADQPPVLIVEDVAARTRARFRSG